jgi:hypothetical protein
MWIAEGSLLAGKPQNQVDKYDRTNGFEAMGHHPQLTCSHSKHGDHVFQQHHRQALKVGCAARCKLDYCWIIVA